MTVGIIVAVVVIIVLWGVLTYNGFVKREMACQEAFATMDVYLKKRFDLIPNLVETVKGYAKHETETLEKVVQLRNAGGSTEESIAAENKITQALGKVFALAEQYPDLKANENFINLMNQLGDIEDEISQSRKYFNAVVGEYNKKVCMIPSNIIAGILGYKQKEMFIAPEKEKENVQVKF